MTLKVFERETDAIWVERDRGEATHSAYGLAGAGSGSRAPDSINDPNIGK
jgi:hypothetical protein